MRMIDRSVDLIMRLIKFADDCETAIQTMNSRYRQARSDIENRCVAQVQSVLKWQKQAVQQLNSKCNEVTTGVSALLRELDKLDALVARVDKYYQKSKIKAVDSTKLSDLATSDDYVEALRQIVDQFKKVSAKYTEKVLPFLINDINYLLSKKRKQDYADLLSLRRLAVHLDHEAKDNLEAIRDEELSAIETKAVQEQQQLQRDRDRDIAALEAAYNNNIDRAADMMCMRLEEVIPDQELSSLQKFMSQSFARLEQINTNLSAFPDRLMPYTYIFPIREYVSLSMIQKLLVSKCAPLCKQDDVLVLPAEFSFKNPFNIMFSEDRRTETTLKCVQQIVYSFLSAMPVSKLQLAVIDPEHHGNSIAPFYELQRVESDLIYENIAVSEEEIAKLVSNLSDYVDEIMRYHLSGEDDTVYDNSESAESILLLVFDYPSHQNDQSISLLQNVLRNGFRCGIHTIIMSTAQTGNIQPERQAMLNETENLCLKITCEKGLMFTSGIECLFPVLPDSKTLASYINRYLLTCSSIKSESFIFHSTIKDLIVAEDEEQVAQALLTLRQLAEHADKTWCKVSDEVIYPEHIVLGGAYYPFSVFVDRPAEDLLRKTYKISNRKGTNSGLNQDFIYLPYSISTRDGFNLYMDYTDKDSKGAINATHHIMWKFLSAFPVSKVKFSIISCERSLNAIAPFVEMHKKLPDVFDDSVCVNSDEITDRLQRINQYIDDALQNKLGHQYDNMVDYNIGTPNRAEPMTVLILFDYPKGFDSHKNELLSNIIRNGRKCGIFILICHNTDLQYSRYDTLDEYLGSIKKNCIQTSCKANTIYLQPYGLEMDISDLPNAGIISAYTREYEEAYIQTQKRGLDFKEIADPQMFERNSAKCLSIPIGLGDGDSVVNVTFGTGSSHHALIAGATGSGKSTLLHTLIMSSMIHYAPSQLHLYLLDFKSGTEFKVYERIRLPHMKLLALDAMQEFGESILEDLVQEMTNRSDAFKRTGCSKVEEYVECTGEELPRILVIMDEFQILYNDMTNRRVANNCAELTKRLVTEGRAFGIHLIMATQSTKVISNLSLEAGTVEQMRVRIGMKCGESDARYLFSDQNEMRALQMMKGPIGTAVMNLEYTEKDNIGLRVAYCSKAVMEQYQNEIATRFADVPYTLQTFEGGRTIDYLDYINDSNHLPYDGDTTEIGMGIMIKVAPPFVLSVDRRKRHNILICGTNERMCENITVGLQLGVLRNKTAQIVEMDGEWLVSDNYESSLSAEIASVVPGYRCCSSRKDIVLAIKDLYEEYLRRKSEGADKPLFVFIRNLQYLDIVQQMLKEERVMEEDYIPTATSDNTGVNFDFGQNYGMDSGSVGDKLLAIINDGASYGIFMVVSSLEFQTVKDCMHYGANTLPKFPERIIFSLGDNDSDHLIEGVTVSRMRDNTVYFTDGVKRAFQYKPYVIPDRDKTITYLKEIYQS